MVLFIYIFFIMVCDDSCSRVFHLCIVGKRYENIWIVSEEAMLCIETNRLSAVHRYVILTVFGGNDEGIGKGTV